MPRVSTTSTHSLWTGFRYDYTVNARVPVVEGISTWDMPDGVLLRREMMRSTRLTTAQNIVRWAKKYSDVTPDQITKAIQHLTAAPLGGRK